MWSRIARLTPEPDNEQACWLVRGVPQHNGYMQLSMRVPGRGPRLVSVHRWILSELRGTPLPPGITTEHRCRVPGCWNPDHLEELPGKLNHRYTERTNPWSLPARDDPLQRAADRAWDARGRTTKRCPF